MAEVEKARVKLAKQDQKEANELFAGLSLKNCAGVGNLFESFFSFRAALTERAPHDVSNP